MKLILKLDRILCVLGAVLLVWNGVSPSSAAEVPARSSDEVLADALPEKAMPQLQEILTKAMRNAPRVISSGLDLELSDTNVKMARAPMLPSMGAGYNFGGLMESYKNQFAATSATEETATQPATNAVAAHTDVTKRTSVALTYSANINQPVYRWGALKKGYQSAQLQRAISERNLSEVRRVLAADVRRAYFNLISAANARETERTTLANLELERDFLKKQEAAGFVTPSIASVAETRITDFKLQMQRNENSYDVQWRSFRQMTGLDETYPTALPNEIPALSKDLGPIIQSLTEQPGPTLPNSLLNADDSIHVERLNYEIYKTRLKPQLGFNLSAYQDHKSPDNNSVNPKQDITAVSALATVSWSIFDGFTTQALKQSSLIRQRQLKSSREQAERDYRESIRSYVTNLRFNWDSLQNSELALVSLRSSAETFQKDYEAGFAPKKAWDDAKTLAENGLQAANNARADYYMQIVNYLSLRGKDPAVVLAAKH